MKNLYYLIIIFTILPYSIFAQNVFKISAGNLKISDNVEIVLLNTKWSNNGTITANNGTVNFTGNTTSGNSAIEGTSETTFYNLTVNKSANNTALSQNITISNTVTLQNGNLELGNNNLDLAGIFVLNNGHYFQTSGTGNCIREISNGSAKMFPVGNGSYTPILITNDGIVDDFSVRTSPEVLNNGITGIAHTSNVVDRTWFIEEALAGGSNLTLTATWNASDELTGFDRTQCYLSHNNGLGWNAAANSAASGTNPFSISRAGITTLSPFAVGSNGILPVELLDFEANLEEEFVQLTWETASEFNSDYFGLEHSLDGFNFTEIARIKAEGYSQSLRFYSFKHLEPQAGKNYYRLRQVDLDDRYEYSKIRIVEVEMGAFWLGEIYPNPVSNSVFKIPVRVLDFKEINIVISDLTGKTIYQKSSILEPGLTHLGFEDYLFPIGLNLLTIEIDGYKETRNFLVEY